MKKKLLSLFLAVISILNVCPFSILPVMAEGSNNFQSIIDDALITLADDYTEGLVELTCKDSNSVTLEKGDKLYATTKLSSQLDEDDVTYIWQLKIGNDKWANITGYVTPFAVITDALLSNAILEDGNAVMRCLVDKNGKKFVSNELTITLADVPDSKTDEIVIPEAVVPDSESSGNRRSVLASLPALAAETEAETEAETAAETEAETEAEAQDGSEPIGGSTAADAFHVVISYTYRHATAAKVLELDGKTAANTFTVTLPNGGFYSGTIATPPEVGYLPYVKKSQEQYVTGYNSENPFPTIKYDGEEYVLANSIQFDRQSDEITVEVFFIPQLVTMRVMVYEQNLYDDEYVLADTQTFTRLANEHVGKGYDTERRGFNPLYYDPELPISEDGSFAIDIYYDRNYYLIDFDLNSGEAYGALNLFVRYKTPVVLPSPIRPGYSFRYWSLDSITDDNKLVVESNSYSEEAQGGYLISSVEHNLNYSAEWKTETTSYTIIYWLENTEDAGFTLDSVETVENVKPGDVISATDTLNISDKNNFTFCKELSDKNVTIAADGTTAINAYYLRKYYTLSFTGNTTACEIVEHTHNENCPTGGCTTNHTHTSSCPLGTCSIEVHTHSMACGLSEEKICGKEEHTHTDSCCSIETVPNHIHSDDCCDYDYHVHDVTNFSDCIKTEHPVHHTSCYSRNELATAASLSGTPKTAYENLISSVTGPLNGYIYRIRATRFGTIYNFLYVHNQWFFLGQKSDTNGVSSSANLKDPNYSTTSATSAKATEICGQELHTHGDGTCVCNKVEHDHTSGCTCTIHVHGMGDCDYTCGIEQHRHTMNCYTFNCGKQIHVHTADCVRACQQVVHTHTNNCQTSSTFLQVRYKYDANISSVWTTVGNIFVKGERWKANTYFTEVLVFLPFMPPTNITFNVNEGTTNKDPYTLIYYLESLDTPGTYEEIVSVKAKYNHLTKAEDFFNIRGFTQSHSDPKYDSNNQVSLSNGAPVKMYYSRNSYDLEFVSMGTTLSPLTKSLKYQQPIGESFEVMAKDVPYPSNEEPGAIEFVGWYTTPNCADGTEFFFDGSTTMPIGGLILYAKWKTCSYTVNVYADKEMTQMVRPYPQTVLFGSYIQEPNHANLNKSKATQDPTDPQKPLPPSYDEETKMVFAGWYYMDGKTEKRFDFNTMPVKSNMDIYAKWTSRIPVNYTIRYVFKNGNEYVDIADPSTGASLAGVTKTFVAKVGTELKDDYRKGYFPEMRSHSMTMSSNEEENVYYFVYTVPQEVKYTVTHEFVSDKLTEVFGEGKNTLIEVFSHTIGGENIADSAAYVEISFREGITKEVLAQAAKDQYGITLSANQKTQLWEIITTLSPSAYLLNLKLTTNSSQNDAKFSWGLVTNQATYQIVHYIESIDGSEYTIYKNDIATATVGMDITATKEFQKDTDHFTLDTSMSTTSGKVESMSWDPNTGTLNEGLILRMYYKRKSYPYTVEHRNYITNAVLVEDTVTYSAKYQEKIYVSDKAINIDGYTLANDSDSLTVTSAENNVLVCKYKGLEVYYQYLVLGMGGLIADPSATVAIGGEPPAAKTLELWSDGFFVNAWYYSIGDGEKKPLPKEWLSENNMTVKPAPPTAEYAGQTVYIYAEVLPTTRRFKVDGFASPENDPQAFVFKLKGTESKTAHVDVTFIIFDNGYTDIALLPYGEYTLTTLHWAWRYGRPTSVTFNGVETEVPMVGQVTLKLETTGDVIITYPSGITEKWLTDDASGVVSTTFISN